MADRSKLGAFEALFLDYLEGTLEDSHRRALEAELGREGEVRRSFKQYQAVIAQEKRRAAISVAPSAEITHWVMQQIRTEKRVGGFMYRLNDSLRKVGKISIPIIAATAAVILGVRLKESGLRSEVPSRRETVQVSPSPSTVPAATEIVTAPPPSSTLITQALTTGTQVQSVPSEVAPQLNKRVAGISESTLSGAALIEVVDLSTLDGGLERPVPNYLRSLAMPDQALPGSSFSARDQYRGTKPSKPVLAAQEAVSTFSIDVDTASYANSRRFIEGGELPPPQAVRTEEFINSFDYGYPVQYERPFSVTYEIAPSPLTPGVTLLKVGIKARDVVDKRKPWNLVFLIDTSGSMASPDKLPLLKKALRLLATKMRPEDRIAIVTYAGSSEVKLSSTSGSEVARITAVIDALEPRGGTNGAGGIQAAYSIAQEAKTQHTNTERNEGFGVNRVVLVTDGDFNVGITSHEELVQMIEQNRKSGVALTTVGVGRGNLNDALLEKLADKGDGNYFYLDSFREARKIFEEKLFGTIETVARDVKLQLEFNPKNVLQYKLLGYENRALERQDFHNDAVDAGDVGSGTTVTALYEVVLHGSSIAPNLGLPSRYQEPTEPEKNANKTLDGELGFLKIRFKAPHEENSQLLEFPLSMAEMKRESSQASPDFHFGIAIAAFAEHLRGAPQAGTSLDAIINLAESALGTDPRGERREAIELMRSVKALRANAALRSSRQ